MSTSRRVGLLQGLLVFIGLFGCLVLLWFFVFRVGPPLRRPAAEKAADRLREFREASARRTGSAMGERFAKMQEDWKKVSATLVGADRRVAEVFASEFGEISPKVQAYEEALKELSDAGFAAPGFASPEEIQGRRKVLGKFIEANRALKQAFEGIEASLKTKMQAAEIAPGTASSNITAFMTAIKTGDTVKLRSIDEETAKLMLEMLDFYEREWGKWSADESGYVDFADDTVEGMFNELREKIEALALQQRSLQEK